MTKILRLRRGTDSQCASFTGAEGEVIVNTDKDCLVLQDGSTVGGFEHVNLNSNQRLTNKDIVGVGLSVVGVSTFAGITTVTGPTLFSKQLNVSGVSTVTSLDVGVGGTIISTTSVGFVGIGTTNPQTRLQIDNIYGIKTGFGTFTSTAGISTTIDSFNVSSTNFKTSEYTLFFNNGNNIQALKLLVMQNGSQAYYQEYGSMFEPNQIVSIAASITSGVCKLEATSETGISGVTTYKFSRETIL